MILKCLVIDFRLEITWFPVGVFQDSLQFYPACLEKWAFHLEPLLLDSVVDKRIGHYVALYYEYDVEVNLIRSRIDHAFRDIVRDLSLSDTKFQTIQGSAQLYEASVHCRRRFQVQYCNDYKSSFVVSGLMTVIRDEKILKTTDWTFS